MRKLRDIIYSLMKIVRFGGGGLVREMESKGIGQRD